MHINSTSTQRHARVCLAGMTLAAAAALAACSSSSTNTSNGTVATTDSASGTLAAGNPPTRAARLSDVQGDVTLQTPGSNSWSQPSLNYTVAPGDRLATGSSGRAELDLGTGAVRLDNGADATVTSLGDNYTQLGLDQGALDASLYQYDPADSVVIDTPNSEFIPTAPGSYLLSYEPSTNSTLVDVVAGALALAAPGLSQVLNAGQMYRLLGTNPVQLVPVTQTTPEFTSLDRWRAERDARWARTGPVAQYVSESIPGWEDLDDNGTWTADQTNTPVWCPMHTTSQYVPYRQGHWAWEQPWGWTWVDDAPWGYATTHYGRWEQITTSSCQNSNNWAWVPAPTVAQPVYAPAVVAFVAPTQLATAAAAPSDKAWFPLGPDEVYEPPYPHSDAYLRAVNATNLREVRDVAPLLAAHGPPNGRWRNRMSALTVVPANVFSAGDPVRGHIVEAPPTRLAAAPVVWNPSLRPAARVIAGGPPARAPHVPAMPAAFFTRAGHGRGNARENARGNAYGQARQAERQANGEVALPPRVFQPHAAPPLVAPPVVAPPNRVFVPRQNPHAMERPAPQVMLPPHAGGNENGRGHERAPVATPHGNGGNDHGRGRGGRGGGGGV